jgi:protein-tyrosine phosphatase
MTRVPFTYTWIENDKILAGSIPQLPEDLAILRSMGVQNILSLTRRNFETYPDMQWGDRHLMASIPDCGVPTDSIAALAVGYLTGSYQDYPVYIHCRGGIGRTGLILLAYYVLQRGLTLAEAKELVKVRRNYEGNASAIDQGSPQKEWIDSLEGHR